MGRTLYFKTIVLGLIGVLALSFLSLFCLVRISDMAVEDYRYGYLLSIARSIEKASVFRPVDSINVNKYHAPKERSLIEIAEVGLKSEESVEIATSFFKNNGIKTTVTTVTRPQTKPSLWLVSDQGEVLSTNTQKALPLPWTDLPLPKKNHGLGSSERSLLDPTTYVMKLETTPITYLISHNEKALFQGPFLWIQGTHTFATAALAVFIALSLGYFYLRRKSVEARAVLAQLEAGKLDARFEIKRLDEFGNLILDFNRMADQIERLVKRLSVTEASRSNLLQELGHDLRTPLTSLTTSFETLKIHHETLDACDRDELYSMIGADIHYFKDLLEKLTIVATIEGPHYKSTTEKIDLSELIDQEMKNRQTGSAGLTWKLHTENEGTPVIHGDQHLITRMIKNGFDNAARYAENVVKVKIKSLKDEIHIFIMDDGPGLSAESIASFGKRRERRHVSDRNSHDFSLGLGSVIMKTIAEAHGGCVSMDNQTDSTEPSGACLKLSFKRC